LGLNTSVGGGRRRGGTCDKGMRGWVDVTMQVHLGGWGGGRWGLGEGVANVGWSDAAL
jgi:hypothetical protein